MQILFGVVSDEEKKQITPVVYSNTIMSMKILVEQATLLGEEVSGQKKKKQPQKLKEEKNSRHTLWGEDVGKKRRTKQLKKKKIPDTKCSALVLQ